MTAMLRRWHQQEDVVEAPVGVLAGAMAGALAVAYHLKVAKEATR